MLAIYATSYFQHAFPWDYKSAELGSYSLNFSKAFIDFFALIGWATDLKTASAELVRKRMLRTGANNNNNSLVDEEGDKPEVWGWDDPALPEEDKKLVMILNKRIFK